MGCKARKAGLCGSLRGAGKGSTLPEDWAFLALVGQLLPPITLDVDGADGM